MANQKDVKRLLKVANEINLPEDALDGDVEDEVQDEARDYIKRRTSEVNDGGLQSQLEYLLDSGYDPSRLEEIMREYKP
jgi:hypothetical protein